MLLCYTCEKMFWHTKLDHFDSTKISEDIQSEELQSDGSLGLRKSFKDIVSQVIKK